MSIKIVNKELPSGKVVTIALTYIYGIGRSLAKKILVETEINGYKKIRDLTSEEIEKISNKVKDFLIEDKLREQNQKRISQLARIGTYRGLRRLRKLPVNGQRTRHNAQTAKKGGAATRKKITVAGKKKAPTPK